MALDDFEARYSAFRSELPPREQVWFDELVCRARRHSNAINRRPHLDFERPVMLAMLMESLREAEDLQDDLVDVRRQLRAACDALAAAGLMTLRPRPFAEMAKRGQVRLAA
jgi:hypothetical protein